MASANASKSASAIGVRAETSLSSSGVGRFDPVLCSGFSGSCNVMVACVSGLCEGWGSICIPGMLSILSGCLGCCGCAFCGGLLCVCFLSVCGQPGITILSMQCMEFSRVVREPELCASAVKVLVIASARVVILIFSPRA